MNRVRVLLVDDQPVLLFTYSVILTQQGYEVTAVSSFEEAADLLRTSSFDVLLCDLSLDEGKSGLEIIQLGRRRDARLASALLTGFETDELRELATGLGIDIIQKSIGIPALLAAIGNLRERRNGALAS